MGTAGAEPATGDGSRPTLGAVVDALAPPDPAARSPRRATTGPVVAPHGEPPAWRDAAAVGVLATLVSVAGSWIPSVWDDEEATLTAARRTWPELLEMLHGIDAVHGAYYAFMHVWVALVGTSSFAIRLPSAVAVGVAAAALVLLTRRVAGRTAALAAGVVLAVLPRVTFLGIEARAQAAATALGVVATLLLVEALARRSTRWWVAYGVVAGLGVVVNVYLALLVVAHGVTVLVSPRARRALGAWCVSAVGAALVAAPVLVVAGGQVAVPQLHQPESEKLVRALLVGQWFMGTTPTHDRTIPFPPLAPTLWAWSVFALAVLGWAAMLLAVLHPRARALSAGRSPVGPVAIAAPWLVLPPLVVVTWSYVGTPVYDVRYFFFQTPAVALLMGCAVAVLRPRAARLAVLLLVVALATPAYLAQRTPTGNWGFDHAQAAAVVRERARAGDGVYFGFAAGGSISPPGAIAEGYPDAFARTRDVARLQTGAQAGTLWGRWADLADVSLDGVDRLWAVLYHRGLPSPERSPVQDELEARGFVTCDVTRGGTTDVVLLARDPDACR